MKMKLYVWEDVLCDYTSGVVFALAANVKDAREHIIAEHSQDYVAIKNEIRKKPKIYDVNKPMCFALAGGA